RRQLRHAQARQGQGVAEAPSALSYALYPNLRLLAQSGGTLLRSDHRGSHPPRRVQEHHGTQGGNSGLSSPAQRQSEAVHLDRLGHGDPRKGRAWTTSVRVGTLVYRLQRLSPTGHLLEDSGGRCVPDERLGVGIMVLQVLLDGRYQLGHAREHAAADALRGDQAEETLDL